MTDDQHRKLSEALHRVQAKVVLSSYHCDLMNELYGDWQHIEAPEKMCHSSKGARTEGVWFNYAPSGVLEAGACPADTGQTQMLLL